MMRRPNQAAREHAEASARSRKAQRDHALSALKKMTDERDKMKEDNDTAERAYSQHLMQELTTQNNLRVHAEVWENAWTKSSKELETERQKSAELRLECDEGIAAAVTLRLEADGHAAEVHWLNQLIEGLRKQRDQGPLQSSHVQNQDHDALKEELAAAKRATKAAHDLIEKECIPRKTHETVKGELGSKQEELRRSNKHGKAIIEAVFPPAEISICNHPNFRDTSQTVSVITLYERLAADWHSIEAQDHQAPTHDLLQAASLSSSLSLEWDICIADGRDLAAYAAGNITMQIRTLWFQICKGAGPFLLLEHIELVLFQSEMSARPTSMDVFVLHQATLRYHDTLPDQLDAAVEPLERVYLCLVGLRLIELVLRLQVRVFQTPDSLEQDCPLDLRPLYARVASFVNEVDFGTDKATFVRCLNFWLSCALGVSPVGSQWRGWVRVIRGFGIPTLGTHDRAIARDPYLVLRVDGSRLTFRLPTAEQVSWEFKADEYVLRFTETRRAVGEDSQLSVPVTLLAIPGSHRRWVDEYLPEIRV